MPATARNEQRVAGEQHRRRSGVVAVCAQVADVPCRVAAGHQLSEPTAGLNHIAAYPSPLDNNHNEGGDWRGLTTESPGSEC